MQYKKNKRLHNRNIIITILFAMITLVALTIIIFATNPETDAAGTDGIQDTTVECSYKSEQANNAATTSTPQITAAITDAITTEIITEPQETFVSLGEYKLTAYCPCSKCCGKWGENRPTDANGNLIVVTASGKYAKANWTVAADTSVLPFGTRIYINGYEYEVQDRGGAVKGNQIDIYFDDHQEALNFGVQYTEIFIKIVE